MSQRRNYLTFITAFLTLLIIALNIKQTSLPESPPPPQAVLLAEQDDLLVNFKTFETFDIDIVSDIAQLSDEDRQTLDVIYIHPTLVEEQLDKASLQQLFADGTIIVAINTPLSLVADKLDTFADIDDLRPEYYTGTQYFTVTIIRSLDPFIEDGHGTWVYADFFKPEDFSIIAFIIEREVKQEY